MSTFSSYEAMSSEILGYLSQDPTIFLINSLLFRTVIILARENKISSFDSISYDYINILEIIPHLKQEIESNFPSPIVNSPYGYYFGIELVGQYSVSWIPVSSPIYINTINTSYCNSLDMIHWQRIVRSRVSEDKNELLLLSLDEENDVRSNAITKLKTFYF